jgi:hypothetical protein
MQCSQAGNPVRDKERSHGQRVTKAWKIEMERISHATWGRGEKGS